MKKRILAVVTFFILTALILVGCKNGGNDSSVEEFESEDGKQVTLTWWLMGGTDEYYQHYWSEMKSLQKIQENVGIKIDFKVAINYDAYLPMMSAKTYPDVITAKNLERYSGRLSAMYTDGVSVSLNNYMDKWMPNFKKIIKKYPDMARDIRLDDGTYSYLTRLYDVHDDDQRALTSTYGLVIRQDWLDAVGMDVPTNMDEWYKVLKAFKQQDPNGNGEADEEPYIACSSGWKYFMPAYGIDDDPSIMVNDKGEEYVVFGYVTEQYKDYLAEMNKWYTEGLLYYMFDGVSLENQRDRVIGNFAGAWKGGIGNLDEAQEDSFINALRTKAPDVKLSPVPWPKTADGKQWCFADISSVHRDTTVITSNAVKNKVDEAAAYIMDYMLSDEGTTLLTWGIEGESYETVGGEKQLMDGMHDMVDFYGHKMEKINEYADCDTIAFPSMANIVADFVFKQKPDYYKEACETWSTGDISYKLQQTCQFTPELQKEAEVIEDEMKNYMSKYRYRFVTGKVPLTNYDAYVEQCKLLGSDQFTDIWQRTYDAYKKR